MPLEEITLLFFAACNSIRVVAYVPQILKAATDKNGASSISFLTWSLFLLAHVSTVAYAIINRSDWGLAACFAINAICCVAILGSRTANGGATPSGCATRIGLGFVRRRKGGGRTGLMMSPNGMARPRSAA